MFFITESIARCGVFQSHRGRDIAGINLIDIFSVIGVHQQDPAETLAHALRRVHDRLARLQRTGVHAEEAQSSDIGVGHDLEGQCRERLVIARPADFRLVGLGMYAFDRRDIQRRGHVIHDRVQQLLYALVLVGSAACNGNHFHVARGFPDDLADLIRGDFFAAEIKFHYLVVKVGNRLQQFIAVLLGKRQHILRDRFGTHVLAEIVVIDARFHIHEIDDTGEAVLASDRKLNGNGVALESVVDHIQNVIKVRAHNVHFVDIDHSGDVIVVSLSPNGFGLGLDAALGTQDRHAAVKHAKRTLDLCRKVHVTRGVDDVDARIAPEAGRGSRGNRDASLLLLFHPVHRRGTLMRFAELVVHAGVEQDPFRRRGLAGVDVGHDADISGFFK